MSEQVTARPQLRPVTIIRWSLPVLMLAIIFAIVTAMFTVDVTEYALVTRFGRVIRVVAEPGLHVTAPFDRIVRLDKRVLFLRLAPSEYLTADKKNVVVDSLATWRISDPERFLTAFATREAAEARLADIVLAEVGAAIGRYPASMLISTEDADRRHQAILSEIDGRISDFVGPTYGIDMLSVDLRSLSLPEQNREHVFDRMKAERAKIAKENRSAGELEAKKIVAMADHEKSGIDADAAEEAERVKAEGDAQASRTYAAAFGQDPKFYEFVRILRAYDKVIDDKTTIFLPADADILRMLRFDAKPTSEPSRAAPDLSTGADLLLNKKPEEQTR
jgi:modulator of FtsH protease HflC